ncbi:hypothetical protein [Bacillus sp. S14(2024)]|uniref:hypothetical protein n=1 Tax=Bacillus sp. S14(2024) TaxID=3162884 RepID=UPI003D204304
MSLEKIAENSLSDKEKMEIIKNEKPVIGERIVTKKQAHLIGEQYDGKTVTSVTFVTNNQVLGNITVYLYDGKVIGKGLRD